MARCKFCNTNGFLLAVDRIGLCAQCQRQLYPQLIRTAEIIKESQELVRSSKNYKTRLSRCDLIVKLLTQFYPYEQKGIQGLFDKSIAECLREIEDTRKAVIRETVSAIYDDARAKSELALTSKAKIKACNDGMLKMRELAKYAGEHPDMEPIVRTLRKHTYVLEYKSFIEGAQKAEFKGNLKKALDHFQEALYFVKTDAIDDSEQQKTICSLERKIEELKERLSKPKKKSLLDT